MSAEVAQACRQSRSVWQWQMDNCCERSDGESVPCANVALENLRLSAREGRWYEDSETLTQSVRKSCTLGKILQEDMLPAVVTPALRNFNLTKR